MAGLTSRFKLNKFGAGTPGSITDDGQKYTSTDRDAIDRLLEQVERHDHKLNRSAVPDPTTAADAVLVVGAGILSAGRQYRYRYSVVDAQGNESMGSPVTTVITPGLLPIPGQPGLYVSNPPDAGSLVPGTYYYALTALQGSQETPLSGAAAISLVTGQGAVRITLPALGQADSYRIWRMGFGDIGFTKIALVTVTEYIDTGAVPADPCACDPGNLPPTSHTGVSNYGARLTLPVDVDLTTARSWRLYRSEGTTFPTASLVHDVVEREDEIDPAAPLLRAWTDSGGRATSGRPLDVDLNMRLQPFTFDSAATLPPVTDYPEYYPLVVSDVLHIRRGASWIAVTSPGGGGGGGGGGAVAVQEPPIMTAPDGGRWLLTVDSSGALSTVATQRPGPPSAPQAVALA